MAIVTLSSILSASCSLIETAELHPDARDVRMFDSYEQVEKCAFIKEIVGTEGHWYNYIFITNKDLTLGAVNDLKNEALSLNANSVHVHTNMSFTTSVTILGQAYRCERARI
ncbi:DUF4156 domain-containing protein [Alkalimarinus coralli]|nr:DUF4156 domain-containing protein [Alkalimarinus coralli]